MKRSYLLVALLAIVALGFVVNAAPFADAPLEIDKGSKAVSESAFTSTAVIKEAPGFHIRVAGYNIAHARGVETGGLNEIGKPSNLKGIAQLIKKNRIDVVGFTEISKGDLRVLFKNQPKFIAKYLGYHHVYAQNVRKSLFMATQGNAIVSKYPIVSHKNHNLYRENDKNEQRSCLEAVLDLGKPGKIRVLVAHLSLVKTESTKQIEEIWKMAEASAEPVILVGDFNSRPGSPRVKWLVERMQDTTANLKTTFKNIPEVKIDYHFIRGPWKYGVSKVIGFDLGYSDHGCVINDYWLQKTK